VIVNRYIFTSLIPTLYVAHFHLVMGISALIWFWFAVVLFIWFPEKLFFGKNENKNNVPYVHFWITAGFVAYGVFFLQSLCGMAGFLDVIIKNTALPLCLIDLTDVQVLITDVRYL